MSEEFRMQAKMHIRQIRYLSKHAHTVYAVFKEHITDQIVPMQNKEFRFKDFNVFSAEGRKVLEKMPLKWVRVQFSDRILLVRVQLWRKNSFRRLYFNTRPVDNPQWEKKGNTMGYISLLPDEYDYDGNFHELIHALNTILDSAK